MRLIASFPFYGPGRWSDRPVVVAVLGFGEREAHHFATQGDRMLSVLASALQNAGLMRKDEAFPGMEATEDPLERYALAFARTATALQQGCGHAVADLAIKAVPERRVYHCPVEHEHADVGMQAVRLAWQITRQPGADVSALFDDFRRRAQPVALAPATRAVIEAAGRKDVPVRLMDRPPFVQDLDGPPVDKSLTRSNGRLRLGHCARQVDIDCSRDDAARLVEASFPEGDNGRVPIVSVTGSSGKTTTCRMIDHVLRAQGHVTGLVCSDAMYIGQRAVKTAAHESMTNHLQVLACPEVERCVFETHQGSLYQVGMAFDWCDVAVCLNVTGDHWKPGLVETLEDLAEIKRSVVERARHAAVLNADDDRCLSMVPHVTADRTCLVSTRRGADDLDTPVNGIPCKCVLEEVGGRKWVVLYEGDDRMPVVAVDEIPAAFGGAAEHNLVDAMHAISACRFLGEDIGDIARGMAGFEMNHESTPGRMNFYDGHPFRVLLDYAKNPDGTARLGAFVDHVDAEGRKLVMLHIRGDLGDDHVRDHVLAALPHFDFFACQLHTHYTGPDPQRTMRLMRDTLVSAGVDEDRIFTTHSPPEAVDRLLELGRPGDLLVFAPGRKDRDEAWRRIQSYRPVSP